MFLYKVNFHEFFLVCTFLYVWEINKYDQKKHTTALLFLFITLFFFSQNKNVSTGNIFDGEPYLAVNHTNSQHMVVAWMGYLPFSKVYIKTKVTFDGGNTWSSLKTIPHVKLGFGSADPSIAFDNTGNVFLAYIDYSKVIDSGAVYVVKSTNGGLNWETPVEVINAHSDPGKYPVDRPWISVDKSGGANNGNIYITSMPPKAFGPLLPPYRTYFAVSKNSGNSFTWRYLDSTNWLAGNIIAQPMPTNCVSSNGVFYGIYPSYMPSQSILPRYILASSSNGGNSFLYHTVFSSTRAVKDSLAKKGYLIRSNPSDSNHLAFIYLDVLHGDMDVFLRESKNGGTTWNSPIRINDDPIANNRMQDLLWADFDADGDLVISWRDRRNGADSTYKSSTEIWASVRKKDSTNFSANFKISNSLVVHDTILEFTGNDFMCIDLQNDTISAVWGDTRNGKLNIWFQRVLLDGTLVSIQQINSEEAPELTIYPNPFVSNIEIKGGNVDKILIYNQNGKLIFTQTKINSSKINLDLLPKGIYILNIFTENGNLSRKIVKQ